MDSILYGLNILKIKPKVRDSKGHVTVYDFDSQIMKPLTITSPMGSVTQFEYDQFGNLLSQIFADKTQVSFEYLEDTGLVSAFTDPMGNQWTYSYNEEEQLIRIEDQLDGCGHRLNKNRRKFDRTFHRARWQPNRLCAQ